MCEIKFIAVIMIFVQIKNFEEKKPEKKEEKKD